MFRDFKELRELSAKDLQSELFVLRKASLDLRLSISVNQLRDVSMFKKTRAQIARVLACLREREKNN